MQWFIQVFITGQPSNSLEGNVHLHCWWPVSIEDLCYAHHDAHCLVIPFFKFILRMELFQFELCVVPIA